MVTGRVPFEADTPLAVVFKHVNEPLPLPSSLQPGLPGSIEKVLLRALAKDPAERYATTGDFLDAWRLAMREAPGVVAAPARPASAQTAVAPGPAAPLGSTGQAPLGGTGQASAPQARPADAKRGGAGWLGVGGVFLGLGAVACLALVCGGVLLVQWASAGLRDGLTSRPTQAAEAFTPALDATVPAEATVGAGVEIPLEGLPRSLTYGGLTYTVTGAVLDSQARPEDGIFLEGDDRLARFKLSILNPTAGFVYADPTWTRLRLADGAEYNSATFAGVTLEAGAAEAQELLFVVPAGTGWEGAVLVVAESGREPAELPLTGDVPPAAYPRALALPEPAQMAAPDGNLQYELLSAALDLDWKAQRAEEGQRFLKLALRLTNTGFLSGVAIGPSVFRLNVGGTPLAPLETTIDVIDYQAALDFDVVFEVPADAAGEATLQLGDVTVPDMQFVTTPLDLTAE
jgi:hypothetical protein